MAPVITRSDIGEITYIDGTVEITRDGEIIDEIDLDIGSEIENYDNIRTGADSELYITVESDRSPQTEIHIAANTVFTVDINSNEGNQVTTLGLITGSFGAKVGKLTGSQYFEVKTESVAMSVRGTGFLVQTSPASDVLVTCDEGEVVCRDQDSGSMVSAEPGQIVEKLPDELFRSVPVAVSQLEDFRKDWIAERIALFKPNALRVLRQYAERYDDLYNRFNAEYEALMLEKAVLEKWMREDAEGKVGGRIQLMQEKKEIIGHLFEIRGVLFIFERIYYRLLELHSYFQQGFGRGQIKPGLSAAIFFERLTAQQKDLHEKIGGVRYIMKLYALRNDGELPLSRF